MSKPRLLFGVPTARHPHIGFVTSLMALRMGARGFRHEIEDFAFFAGPVQMARTLAAEQALSKGYDYIVMQDDDLNVAHRLAGDGRNVLDAMLETAEADPKVGEIGAVYLREAPMVPTVNLWHPTLGGAGDGDNPGEQVNVVCRLPAAPFEVAGVGTGLVLIRVQALREVCERTKRDPFAFWPYETFAGTRSTLGEDFYFSWRMQQTGWKVLADPRPSTIHHKDGAQLKYEHAAWEAVPNHQVSAPTGARVIEVNGIQCIDVSETRRLEAARNQTLEKAA